MKCKCCGGSRFIGHQILRADILVDENGKFADNLFGGLEPNIYDSEKPYGPFTCMNCGAEYNTLNDNVMPSNMYKTLTGKWYFEKDGAPVIIYDIKRAKYVSVWDDFISISTECEVDMKSHQILNIEKDEAVNGGDSLTREYVEIDGKAYEVGDKSSYEKGYCKFWTE